MRVVDRIIIILLSLFVAIIGCGLIFCAFNQQVLGQVVQAIVNGPSYYGWFLLVVGAVLIILAAIIIVGIALHRQKLPAPKTIAANLEEGKSSVELSVNAVDSIIKRAAAGVTGIGEVKNEIRNSSEGIVVQVKAPLIAQVNIPEVSSNLQSVVRQQLETMAGLKVADIQVLITDVAQK